MKMLSAILSFYILGLTLTPALQLLKSKFLSCKESCSNIPGSEKDNDGCDKKTCTVFSCCFKTQAYPPIQYKVDSTFYSEFAILQNFKPNKDYISLKSFEIWHPPKFI